MSQMAAVFLMLLSLYPVQQYADCMCALLLWTFSESFWMGCSIGGRGIPTVIKDNRCNSATPTTVLQSPSAVMKMLFCYIACTL